MSHGAMLSARDTFSVWCDGPCARSLRSGSTLRRDAIPHTRLHAVQLTAGSRLRLRLEIGSPPHALSTEVTRRPRRSQRTMTVTQASAVANGAADIRIGFLGIGTLGLPMVGTQMWKGTRMITGTGLVLQVDGGSTAVPKPFHTHTLLWCLCRPGG